MHPNRHGETFLEVGDDQKTAVTYQSLVQSLHLICTR